MLIFDIISDWKLKKNGVWGIFSRFIFRVLILYILGYNMIQI